MNNVIKRVWNKNAMVNIEDLRGMAFQAESGGHTFQISGIDGDGNPVALSGTPAGVMIRSDNQDVPLTCSISDGKVNATLPANAYSVPGRFGITIFLTSDGQKTAIYAAAGTVGKTSSGTVAPPAGSDVVDLVNAIAAAVATIPASYTDLMAAMAPTYSSSGLYAVGNYAWYNGKLYRCTTPITSGETWTSGHWTLANLGSDLVDLKSALNLPTLKNRFNTTNSTPGKYVGNDGILRNNSIFSVTDYIPVKPGKKYRIYNIADNNVLIVQPGTYADESKSSFSGILSNSYENHVEYREITVPSGYYYIRLNYITSNADSFYFTEEIDNNSVGQMVQNLPHACIVPTKNIIKFNDPIKNAYMSASGEQSSIGYDYTDYIPVNPNTVYTIKNCLKADGTFLTVPGFLYDSNKANPVMLTNSSTLSKIYTDSDGNHYFSFYTGTRSYIIVNGYSAYIDTMMLYDGYPDINEKEKLFLHNIIDDNLFVSDGIKNQYWNGSSAVALDGFGFTDWIPIKGGEKYTIANIFGTDGNLLGTPGYFLNVSGENLGTIKTGWTTVTDGINTYAVINSPSNASFVILNYHKDFVDIMSMVEGDNKKVLNSLCLGTYALAQVRRIAGISKSSYKIAFLGDSLTYGVGTNAPYWKLIANETGWECLNFGKGGTGYCTRYNSDDNFNDRVNLIPSDVDCIVVFGGTNDYGNGSGIVMGDPTDADTSTFYGGVNQLFNTLCDNYTYAPKIILTPIRRADNGGGDTPNARGNTLGDYVNAIKNRANAFAFPVCDLYVDSELSPDMNATVLSTFFADNVHPNNAGHRMFYKMVLSKLKEVLH